MIACEDVKHLRRRQFSIPFVLVIGCGPKAPPAPPAKLPPAPGTGAVTRSTTEEGLVLLTYESGDKIYVHADGKCFAEYACNSTTSDTGEPVYCNPPPPQQVTCPTDAKK